MRRRAAALLLLLAAPARALHPGGLGEPAHAESRGAGDDVARPRQPAGQVLPLTPTRRIAFNTDEGSWMSLDIAPDGTAMAFDLLGDLYTLPIAGGRARAITRGLGFDTQPAFSPDGRWIAYVSDRSGAENLWLVRPDGSGARQISFVDDDSVLVSPAWAPDGRTLFVSRYRPSLAGYELWRYGVDGSEQLIAPVKPAPDAPRDRWTHRLGAVAAPDGRHVYVARRIGGQETDRVDEWTIVRRDLASGAEDTIVAVPDGPRKALDPGSAFRPALSPDGRLLAYATRLDNRTGLRLRDLATGADRWLAYPIEHDQLQATSWQDLVPRYAFTPDGKALLLSRKGRFERIEVADGRATPVPFTAEVDLRLGPLVRAAIAEESGPVRARIIQTPEASPDGRMLAFSALGHVYLAPLDGKGVPRRLTAGDAPEYHPAWSPDGRSIAFVTWSAAEGGHVWVAPAEGGAPRRVTQEADFYTRPVFTPDGAQIVALRSSSRDRMRVFMEYGQLREAALVAIPAQGGAERVIAKGRIGGRPHFAATMPGKVLLPFGDGLSAFDLAGGARSEVARVLGPGWYFQDGAVPVDDLRMSPDGKWILAQVAQQLHLVAAPPPGRSEIDLSRPGLPHRRLTAEGADFFGWSPDSRRSIHWALGAEFMRRPLAGVVLNPPDRPGWAADAGGAAVEHFAMPVALPRDVPEGRLLLRGGRAITMRGEQVIEDADILIDGSRIAAVGARGSIAVPPGTAIRDVTGRTILPGFIDTHDHIADVRRDVLDLSGWGLRARLAWGITTAFDPSSLTIDMLVYRDLLDAGLMTGPRLPTTGTALFSFNRIQTLEDARAVLRRYRDAYRLRNIKQYRIGSRRQRELIAIAAAEMGLHVTTEGALALKFDLTQIQDGFGGSEHALVAPIYRDVVAFLARSGTSYTTTLQIGNGGTAGQDHFIIRDNPHDDAKLRRFTPHYALDQMTRHRAWQPLDEFLFPEIAAGAARVQRAGGLVGIGAHGEIPGPGFHWEMEAHVMGGMTPMEALHAGTIGSARTIGRDGEFGSIEPGKFADLVILDADPRGDIRNSRKVAQVMKNGRLYDAATLGEVWPRERMPGPAWFADEMPEEGRR